MNNVSVPRDFQKVCLWMDSTDFPLENVGGKKKKDPDWSFKCNSKGRRYMVLRDGKGVIRKLWGGYSPKVFDGTWLQMHKHWLLRHLKGAGVIADQHFEWGKNLRGVTFYTKIMRGKKRPSEEKSESEDTSTESEESEEEEENDKGVTVTTKKEELFNKRLYKIRARIEVPFGESKTVFKVLQQHWMESESQLDYMVYIAAAVSNRRRKC